MRQHAPFDSVTPLCILWFYLQHLSDRRGASGLLMSGNPQIVHVHGPLGPASIRTPSLLTTLDKNVWR